jgi:hypothetical protein
MGARSYPSSSSTNSTRSNSSHTQSTAPTSYSSHRPSTKHYNACPQDFGYQTAEPEEYGIDSDGRASTDTYASTTPSEDVTEQPSYEIPSERHKTFASDAVPSTPSEFAELFPSTRKLLIRHDESTSDGNMNLRVDAEISASKGRRFKMTLFHLRMRDLSERQFSLRRYCRDSGREVCNSSKKYIKPTRAAPRPRRPTLQRSLTSALHALSIGKKSPPRRYNSDDESDDSEDDSLRRFTTASEEKPTVPTNIIKLEFSNYAQVEVHRRRTRKEKHYDFEYWGSNYRWSRTAYSDRNGHHSFSLTDLTTSMSIARITPDRVSRREALEDRYQGAWVPPCVMQITDRSISDELKTDLADVIIATGLIALTDDCIKRRWHSGNTVRMSIPRQGTRDYIEPGQLIDEVFNRHAPAPRIHQQRSNF